MHLPEVVSNLQRRALRPSTWVAALVFGGVWILIRVMSGIHLGDMGIGEFLVPTGLLAGHLILSPVPWQWSGDGRQVARPWRGGLQALVWNAAWLGLFLLLLQGAFRPPPPQRDRVGSTESESKTPESGGESSPGTSPAPTAPREEPAPQEAPKLREDPPLRREEAEPRRPADEGDRRPLRQEEEDRRPPRRDGERPPRSEDSDRERSRRPDGQRPPRPEDEAGPERPPRPRNDRDARPPRPEEGDRPRPRTEREPVSLPVIQALYLGPTASATPLQRLSSPGPEPSGRNAQLAQARPPKPKGLLPVLPEHRSELMLLLMNFPFAIVLGWFLAEKERAESTEEELQAKAREARTRALQAQLHPHALYNTLSGLTELVHEDPDAAEEALVGLTELLRLLTRHANATELPLGQERTLLRHFLAIEQIRLGPRLSVSWNWPDWADALVLPPLLLQPLVENAVKHGIATAPEGGALKIGIYRAGRDLILRVANTGSALDARPGEGTGLQNLRQRLELLEALDGTLSLRSEEGWTVAELRLRPPAGSLPEPC